MITTREEIEKIYSEADELLLSILGKSKVYLPVKSILFDLVEKGRMIDRKTIDCNKLGQIEGSKEKGWIIKINKTWFDNYKDEELRKKHLLNIIVQLLLRTIGGCEETYNGQTNGKYEAFAKFVSSSTNGDVNVFFEPKIEDLNYYIDNGKIIYGEEPEIHKIQNSDEYKKKQEENRRIINAQWKATCAERARQKKKEKIIKLSTVLVSIALVVILIVSISSCVKNNKEKKYYNAENFTITVTDFKNEGYDGWRYVSLIDFNVVNANKAKVYKISGNLVFYDNSTNLSIAQFDVTLSGDISPDGGSKAFNLKARMDNDDLQNYQLQEMTITFQITSATFYGENESIYSEHRDYKRMEAKKIYIGNTN